MFIKNEFYEKFAIYNLDNPPRYGLQWRTNSFIQAKLERQEYLRFVEYERGLTTEEQQEKIELNNKIDEEMLIINITKAKKEAEELRIQTEKDIMNKQIRIDIYNFYNENLEIDTSFIDRDFDDLQNKELFIIDATIRHYKYFIKELKNINRSNYDCRLQLLTTSTREDFKKVIHHITEYDETLKKTIKNFHQNSFYDSRFVIVSIVKNQYLTLINDKLIDAEAIYQIKKNESILKRKAYKNEFNSTKKLCECGAEVTSRNAARHKLTSKHIKYIQQTSL